MRRRNDGASAAIVGAWILAALAVSAHPRATQAPDGADVIAKGRAFIAASPEADLSLKSLELRGKAMRLVMSSAGERLVPHTLVVRFELPDKYLQITRRDALAITMRAGLVDGRVVYDAIAENPWDQAVAKPAPDEARTQREHFARYLLALLLRDTPSFPLKFQFLGTAQAPSATALAVKALGPDEFAAEVFIDPSTHRPLMLRYVGLQLLPRGATPTTPRPPLPAAPGSALALSALRTPELTTWYLSDYRVVDGLRLPHRITKEAAGVTLEDLYIESFKVNPRFTVNDFK